MEGIEKSREKIRKRQKYEKSSKGSPAPNDWNVFIQCCCYCILMILFSFPTYYIFTLHFWIFPLWLRRHRRRRSFHFLDNHQPYFLRKPHSTFPLEYSIITLLAFLSLEKMELVLLYIIATSGIIYFHKKNTNRHKIVWIIMFRTSLYLK